MAAHAAFSRTARLMGWHRPGAPRPLGGARKRLRPRDGRLSWCWHGGGRRERVTGAITPMSTITTNQFKNGNHIEVDGTVFKVLEFQHVKPGKGGAFVRTKLRRASDGAVIDRTFRAGEKFRAVRTEVRRMQFLYKDGTDAHFMDTGSYEQLTIPEAALAEPLKWIRDSDEVEVLYVDERPADVQLPSAVDLEVAQTDPG